MSASTSMTGSSLSVQNLPTRHNFYMEFLMLSEYRDLEHGPAYLNPSNYESSNP